MFDMKVLSSFQGFNFNCSSKIFAFPSLSHHPKHGVTVPAPSRARQRPDCHFQSGNVVSTRLMGPLKKQESKESLKWEHTLRLSPYKQYKRPNTTVNPCNISKVTGVPNLFGKNHRNIATDFSHVGTSPRSHLAELGPKEGQDLLGFRIFRPKGDPKTTNGKWRWKGGFLWYVYHLKWWHSVLKQVNLHKYSIGESSS